MKKEKTPKKSQSVPVFDLQVSFIPISTKCTTFFRCCCCLSVDVLLNKITIIYLAFCCPPQTECTGLFYLPKAKKQQQHRLTVTDYDIDKM